MEVAVDDDDHNGPEAVGIDLGVKTLLLLSDGVVAENQRTTLQYARRQRKLNKKLSRPVKGSNNWWKTVYKLRQWHEKIRNQRQVGQTELSAQVDKLDCRPLPTDWPGRFECGRAGSES